MITHTPPIAGNLPVKTLVARQQPTNSYTVPEIFLLYVIITAIHGDCYHLAVQIHYFIWHDDNLSGHSTVLLLGDQGLSIEVGEGGSFSPNSLIAFYKLISSACIH